MAAAWEASKVFLEAYPFPAFVLALSDDISRPIPLMPPVDEDPGALDLLWANEQYHAIADGRSLFQCLTPEAVKTLTDWLHATSDGLSEDHEDDDFGGRIRKWRADLGGGVSARTRGRGVRSFRRKSLILLLGQIRVEMVCTLLPGTAIITTTPHRIKTRRACSRSCSLACAGNHGPRPRRWQAQRRSVDSFVPHRNQSNPRPPADKPIFKRTNSSGMTVRSHNSSVTHPRSPSAVTDGTSPFSTTSHEPSRTESSLDAGVMDGSSLVFGRFVPGQPIFINGEGEIKNVPTAAPATTADDPKAVSHLLHNKDWGKTPLGNRQSWSESLRSVVSMMSLFPMGTAVYWGWNRNFTLLYNQTYANSIDPQLHTKVYGSHGKRCLECKYSPPTVKLTADLTSTVGPLTDALLAGCSIYQDDAYWLRLDCDGTPMEAYRSLLWAPIKNEQGEYGGIWHAVRDTTPKVIADRRVGLLRDLGEGMSAGRSLHDFERSVLETLHAHPRDVPFAILYFVDESRSDTARLRLAGSIGVPADHVSAPERVGVYFQDAVAATAVASSVYESDHDSPVPSYASTFDAGLSQDPGWSLAEVMTSRQTMVMPCEHLMESYSVRIWEELPTQASVIPICLNSEQEVPGGVLILGHSSRIKYDDQYRIFVEDLRFQLASYLSALRSYDADQRRLGDLAILDRSKSLMLSNVSHELLAPLTLIAGPLDDVLSDMPEGIARNLLTMARANVNQVSRLVSMLVDINSLEAGTLRGSFEKVNLGMLTRNVAAMFSKTATKHGVTYNVDCDERPRNVYVDKERWEKILFSVIESALKYTEEGYIEISLHYTHKHAILTVEDTGIGIPSAGVDELNQGLFPNLSLSHQGSSSQSPTSKKDGSKGASIALTFAKKLVQLHSGDMEIESRTGEDHGTVLRVRIPLGSQHLPPDAVAQQSGPTTTYPTVSTRAEELGALWTMDRDDDGTESTTSATLSSGETKRSRGVDPSIVSLLATDVIMIVQDLPDAQRYLVSIFEAYCRVVVVRDGQDALDKWASSSPDLVISDVLLPGMNGIALLDALRAGTRDQQLVPVMLLGASTSDRRSNEVLSADDYLTKPFNARELIVRANMQMRMGKERRKLERLFEERTQELRLLSDHSPAGILRCDEHGHAIYANLALREMAELTDEDLNNPDSFGHPDEDYYGLKEWFDFIHSKDLTMEITSRWKCGRWFLFKLARLDGTNGPKGFIGSAIDVTAQKENEKIHQMQMAESERRRVEAEDARQQQELLIDITSHEIRNPISSILQCSSMVRANLQGLYDTLGANQRFHPTTQLLVSISEDLEALDSIYQCGLAQERISNDVLSLGKMQLGLLQMFDVETSIPAVARKVLSIFQNEARMNRITLSLELSSAWDAVGTVMTDPVRLTQIITNLLSNAIRFTANSDLRRVELRVGASLRPPVAGSEWPASSAITHAPPGVPVYVYIGVKDTGPGLTPDELSRLFQRFAQASPMTHTVFGGSGLGLFVCRKLAERMGGAIEVASEHGRGSEFRFYIKTEAVGTRTTRDDQSGVATPPLVKGTEGNIAAAMLRKSTSASAKAAAGPIGMACNVLVVEDNLINRKVLLRQLKHVGIVADSATNGVEALGLIEKNDYDCVLMDLEMPVMDGYSATRAVREMEAAGKIRHRTLIVALTGNARQAQLQDSMADFDGAVIKPYRLDDLLRRMNDLIDVKNGRKV